MRSLSVALALASLAVPLVAAVTGLGDATLVTGISAGVGVLAVARSRQPWLMQFVVLLALVGAARLGYRVTAQYAHDAPDRVDLARTPVTAHMRGLTEISGEFAADWAIREFEVEGDARPDQNQRAQAVLVPFVAARPQTSAASADADSATQQPRTLTLREDEAVVVARVPEGDERSTTRVTLAGVLQPLPDELRDALVQVPPGTPGVLLDTMAPPPADPRGTAALALLFAVFGVSGVRPRVARSAPQRNPT